MDSGAGSVFLWPFLAEASWKFGKGEFGIPGWIWDNFHETANLTRIPIKLSLPVLPLDTGRWIFLSLKKRGTSLEVAGLCNRSRL